MPPSHSHSSAARSNALTAREIEIVQLLADGLHNKCIATALRISPWTVASHLRRMYAKLGVHNRAQLVAKTLHHWRAGQDAPVVDISP